MAAALLHQAALLNSFAKAGFSLISVSPLTNRKGIYPQRRELGKETGIWMGGESTPLVHHDLLFPAALGITALLI